MREKYEHKKGKFLETILAEKRLEIAKMPEEQVGKVRQTYNFYDYLKNIPTSFK